MSKDTATPAPPVRNKTLQGFDYVAGSPLALKRSEWRDKLEAVIAADGSHKRIAGDMTALDAKGFILFEVYEY